MRSWSLKRASCTIFLKLLIHGEDTDFVSIIIPRHAASFTSSPPLPPSHQASHQGPLQSPPTPPYSIHKPFPWPRRNRRQGRKPSLHARRCHRCRRFRRCRCKEERRLVRLHLRCHGVCSQGSNLHSFFLYNKDSVAFVKIELVVCVCDCATCGARAFGISWNLIFSWSCM